MEKKFDSGQDVLEQKDTISNLLKIARNANNHDKDSLLELKRLHKLLKQDHSLAALESLKQQFPDSEKINAFNADGIEELKKHFMNMKDVTDKNIKTANNIQNLLMTINHCIILAEETNYLKYDKKQSIGLFLLSLISVLICCAVAVLTVNPFILLGAVFGIIGMIFAAVQMFKQENSTTELSKRVPEIDEQIADIEKDTDFCNKNIYTLFKIKKPDPVIESSSVNLDPPKI